MKASAGTAIKQEDCSIETREPKRKRAKAQVPKRFNSVRTLPTMALPAKSAASRSKPVTAGSQVVSRLDRELSPGAYLRRLRVRPGTTSIAGAMSASALAPRSPSASSADSRNAPCDVVRPQVKLSPARRGKDANGETCLVHKASLQRGPPRLARAAKLAPQVLPQSREFSSGIAEIAKKRAAMLQRLYKAGKLAVPSPSPPPRPRSASPASARARHCGRVAERSSLSLRPARARLRSASPPYRRRPTPRRSRSRSLRGFQLGSRPRSRSRGAHIPLPAPRAW